MCCYTVICIGSNIEGKETIVAGIAGELQTMLSDFKSSGIYENADDLGVGNPYANSVCSGLFHGDMEQLLEYINRRQIEYGRTKYSKANGIMPLDIDIVVFDGCIISNAHFSKHYFMQGYRQLKQMDRCQSLLK